MVLKLVVGWSKLKPVGWSELEVVVGRSESESENNIMAVLEPIRTRC